MSRIEVRQAAPTEHHHGISIALAAQSATGFPTDRTPEELREVLSARQSRALGVWLAWHHDTPVGHGLIEPIAPGTKWEHVTDTRIAQACRDNRLVELGGLAVHPDHHRQGIANALVQARLQWVTEHNLEACTSVWANSEGSTRLAQRYGYTIGVHPTLPIDRYAYHPTR